MDQTNRLDDLDPGSWAANWRDLWETKEQSKPMPRAWHRCGLCFFFEFEQIDEHGNWGWVVFDDDVSQSRLFELLDEMGDEAFDRFSLVLGRQAKLLWAELGHGDLLLRKSSGS